MCRRAHFRQIGAHYHRDVYTDINDTIHQIPSQTFIKHITGDNFVMLVFNSIFPNWSLLPIANLHKYFLKIKKFPYFCWDLNPQPLAYELRALPQGHQGR